MSERISARRLVAALLVSVGTGACGTSPALASTVSPAAFTLSAGSLPLQVTSVSALPGGQELTTWSGGGFRVSAAGAAGSTVVLTRLSATHVEVGVIPPASTPTPMSQAQASNVVYSNALAVGFSPAQAANQAHSAGLPAPGESGSSPSISTASSAPIIGSPCTSVLYGLQNTMVSQACDVVTLLQAKPELYYIENSINSVGYTYWDCCHAFTQLNAWYQYNGERGDVRVARAPGAAQYIPSGSPITIGIGVGYGGFSLSGSVTVQPTSTFGPYYPHGIDQPAFGSIWDGANYKKAGQNPTYNAADSNAIVHLGPGQAGVPRVYVGMGWN